MAWYWIVLIVLAAIALWIFLSAMLIKIKFLDDDAEAVALGIIFPVALIIVFFYLVDTAAIKLAKRL